MFNINKRVLLFQKYLFDFLMLTEKLLNNDTLETCYISSGCNRTPLSVDWGENNLVCYGSRNAVMIYKPEVCTFCSIVFYKDIFINCKYSLHIGQRWKKSNKNVVFSQRSCK